MSEFLNNPRLIARFEAVIAVFGFKSPHKGSKLKLFVLMFCWDSHGLKKKKNTLYHGIALYSAWYRNLDRTLQCGQEKNYLSLKLWKEPESKTVDC